MSTGPYEPVQFETFDVRTAIDSAVVQLLRGAGRDVRPPSPADKVVAALALRAHASGVIRRAVPELRAAGTTWAEVAPLLKVGDAEAAFEAIAGTDGASLVWRCGSCDALVTDHGPYNSHPDDTESGHAADCRRHQDDIDRWRQQIEGDDELHPG